MQIRSGASKRTNPDLNRARQLVDHLLPLGPRTVTLKNPPRGADEKSVPHTEPVLFRPRNLYMTAGVFRRFGGSIAKKCGLRQHARGGCKQRVGRRGGGARIAHQVVADPELVCTREQAGLT